MLFNFSTVRRSHRHPILIASLALAGCSSSYAVPSSVQQAFNLKYPGINARWEEKPYGYEAVFVKDGREYEAEFSRSGQWLETEYELGADQFSAIVLERVRQQYPGYAVTKHEIELTPNGTFYEVEIERGDEEIELYFDERGNLISNANEDA
ncbi:PepSY-like domain-containing protein [Leptolyngbya sp. FACHB-17]|uniref:PepSY-like domain-containing protein n=1 Tax=unclassified Leptolyngbya TaxID=2650499 RepID=UPI00167FFF28|nr:PepSY-like domain-containing protein [Leptolyngbya sp. FACHB-17]MBD2083207.1 PepSY-like domain-containing protein [Leptolyngbya sp. FACHB-17]